MNTQTAAQTYSFFMLVKTTPSWLKLAPPDRFAFLGRVIEPILKKYPAVRMRFFDAEAFCARYSDVILWQTSVMSDYSALVECLRETQFWDGYFEVLEIIPAVENGYASHYDVPAVGSATVL
jgi:Darcynin, domain of unknown function